MIPHDTISAPVRLAIAPTINVEIPNTNATAAMRYGNQLRSLNKNVAPNNSANGINIDMMRSGIACSTNACGMRDMSRTQTAIVSRKPRPIAALATGSFWLM